MNDKMNLAPLIKKAGIPTKEVESYGSQIVITCLCSDSANQVAAILQKASFKLRGIVNDLDETKETADMPNRRDYVKVVRVFACL